METKEQESTVLRILKGYNEPGTSMILMLRKYKHFQQQHGGDDTKELNVDAAGISPGTGWT